MHFVENAAPVWSTKRKTLLQVQQNINAIYMFIKVKVHVQSTL